MTNLMRTNKRYMTMVFAMTTAFFWFSLYAYIPELSTYAEHLGASYQFIGLIGGSYGLTQLLLRIPLGIFSDAIGKRKPFILFGLLIAFISSMITFLNPNAFSLLITRLLAGVSASTWVVFTVLFSSYYLPEEAKKSIGAINSYNAMGQLIAMTIGGFVSFWWGTRYLFLLSAIGALIALGLGVFITDQGHEKKQIVLKDFLTVVKEKRLLWVSFLAILSQLITFATIFGFVPILAKRLGAEGIQLSLLTILAIIPAVIVARLAGDLFPRTIGVKRTLIIGLLGSGLVCAILPWVTSLSVLYMVQFLSGVARSMVFPLLMGLGIEGIALDKRATAMGIFQALYGIGMVFGPILLGFIAGTFGLTAGFGFTGMIGVLGVVLIYRMDFRTGNKGT